MFFFALRIGKLLYLSLLHYVTIYLFSESLHFVAYVFHRVLELPLLPFEFFLLHLEISLAGFKLTDQSFVFCGYALFFLLCRLIYVHQLFYFFGLFLDDLLEVRLICKLRMNRRQA